jgi:transcription initiation factor IIF auxiliary subunit
MSKKTTVITCVAVATMAAMVACGVPEADYEKIATELQQVNEEHAMCSEQLVTDKAQLAQLQREVAMLTKENVVLKAKLVSKKPAAINRRKL